MSADLYTQALQRFQELFARAQTLDIPEPAAMSLATADADGRPSVRTVLLKAVDQRGFVFYTNMRSRKGSQLLANPHAALCLFWQPLMEQALVEGAVQPVSDAEADQYWATRERMSQIGAWASQQSQPLPERAALEKRYDEFEQQFSGQSVPRPQYWTGFRLQPDLIEFWKSRPGRLHERERYFSQQGRWQWQLLYP
ncbi:MAG: pyridoxamine 5'-phosphate oxidase [Gammaproteobacteria bacterium]|nr:pyridoxamine 5'-phosphate oxidase [Gammaproteobacteria bacterium]MDE2346556.1 pyridoxamine 5'-phosphate oxidase [Gammaproteobacteria bacterium]